jgi:hypothetical protein
MKPSIFHIRVVNKLKENCEEFTNEMEWGKVRNVFWRCHIPKDDHNTFFNELKNLGYVKWIGKNKVKIL